MGVISSTLDEHVVLVDKKLDAWRTLSENSESSMKAVVPNTVRTVIADAAKSYAEGQEEVHRQISCMASQLTAVQNTFDSVAARCCAFDTRLEVFERLVLGTLPASSTSMMASSSTLRTYSLSESIIHTQETLAQLTTSVAEAHDEARLGKTDFSEMFKCLKDQLTSLKEETAVLRASQLTRARSPTPTASTSRLIRGHPTLRANSIGLTPNTGQTTGPSELSLPFTRHSDEFNVPNEPINLSTDSTDTGSRNQGIATAQTRKTQNLEDSMIHDLEKDIQEPVHFSQLPDSSSNIIVRLILGYTD